MDEYRTLRDRLADLEGDRSRGNLPRPQERYTYSGQVYSGGSIPTTVPAVFLTHPIKVDASESEGATPTLTADTTTSVPVLVLGPGVPIAGTNLMARMAGARWACNFGVAKAGVTIPNCACGSVPLILDMVNLATSCNGGGYFNACTIEWQAIPSGMSGLSLGDGTNAFLSDQSFTDSLGLTYRYYMDCSTGLFTLTRVYLVGPFGGPFRDTVRYSWDFTASGNSCSPFALTNGFIYTGGDTACNGQVQLTDGT